MDSKLTSPASAALLFTLWLASTDAHSAGLQARSLVTRGDVQKATGRDPFGFPIRDFSKPGTELTVEANGNRLPATVQALPFNTKG